MLVSVGLLHGVEVKVSEGNRALLPVIIAPEASDTTRELAATLAEKLGAMTGATFTVAEGPARSGIMVGTIAEWEGEVPFDPGFTPGALDERDSYVLRTLPNAVWLLGANQPGASHAVWDFLFRLGYRQFFPRPTWEHIPQLSEISVSFDERQQPDFWQRNVWSGGRHLRQNAPHFETWRERNRTSGGIALRTGHVYGRIFRDRRAEFDANPEYYALVNGERAFLGGNTKFCISNPGLRRLVIDWAEEQMRNSPTADSISMDPSDGGNWCECIPCAEMGTVSDRVVILANEVAEAINNLGLGQKVVGIYAYAHHSPPPNVEVHPQVVVSVATSFVREGWSVPNLIEAWKDKGATIGLREYYSITIWSRDLPGRTRVVNMPYLERTIPLYHGLGARFNSANISDSWGPVGPGVYVLSRLLWDVSEVERIPEILQDFYQKAFQEAAEPMQQFYDLIMIKDADQEAPLLSEDLIGRMYRQLNDARNLAANNPIVLERIDDLTLYTRFLDLYLQTQNASGAEARRLGDEWLRFAFSTRDRMMMHVNALSHRRMPAGAVWPDSDSIGDFRTTPVIQAEEIAPLIAEGIENNQLLTFTPVNFSDNLVPSTPLNFPATREGSWGSNNVHRSVRDFLIWIDEPGEFSVEIQGGRTYQNRGPVRISLSSPEHELVEPFARAEVPPDQEFHTVTLTTPFKGLHTLRVTDGDGRFRINFPEGMPVTLEGGFRAQVGFNLYFYVPKGTKVVGGYADATQRGIHDANGNEVYSFAEHGIGYFAIPVPEGQDGRLWRAHVWRGRGDLRLMTVPNYLSDDGARLLLPAEVVRRDSQ